MSTLGKAAAVLAAGALLASAPALAGGSMAQAEKLRRLDIMLMVTGLRCRTGASDFRDDYGRFTTAHIGALQDAAHTLRSQYVAQYGARGADRALDRMSVSMANEYGQGHPWLNCAQLKQVASSLAIARGDAPLLAAADQVLGGDTGPAFALAH